MGAGRGGADLRPARTRAAGGASEAWLASCRRRCSSSQKACSTRKQCSPGQGERGGQGEGEEVALGAGEGRGGRVHA